jgi:acyl carrier protein
VPGELYIGGVGLARGYLNRPDLTAERFIPHPFDPTPGARLYKTGDLARYLPSGEIEFIGRSDQQVKLRGFRIELGEIEAVLRQHRGVREAVVIAREDTPGDKRLVAYLVAAAEEMPSWGTLRGFVQERLPAYMLPDHFVFLEALPQSPNGKLDRQALPTPEAVGLAASAEVAPPRTPTEARLAGIFADVLGLPQVGVRTNFFEMGGHSLLGVRVLARVRDAFQVELPLSSLFQQSTVEELAAEIERLIRASMELLSEEEARRLLG